jgi:hypothetical protein
MTTTEAAKQVIRELCMEIIGLSYESKPDPIKILNRSMALANANATLAREWAATVADEHLGVCGNHGTCNADIAAKIRQGNK